MNTLLRDIRLSLRQLGKSPGFTLTAVITLAIAIGVNSAMISLVNGVVFRPVVPVKPEEVVNLFTARANAERDYRQFSHAEFESLRAASDVFADVAAIDFSLGGIDQAGTLRRSFVFFVSENALPLLGATPWRGRFFTAEESRPNANLPVVVASHGLWQRLGARDDFLGSTLRVNDRPYTVVGITPPGFSGINAVFAPDLWMPLGLFSQLNQAFTDDANATDLAHAANFTLNLVARLHPGSTIADLDARLPVLARRLQELQPPDGSQGDRTLIAQPPSRFDISTDPSEDGPIAAFGALLVGMAGVVLLIACLNLANMMLARAAGRSREIAVRLAIGASRGAIVRQLLVEGLLLALAGGTLGLLLSFWTGDVIVRSFSAMLTTISFTVALQLTPDLTVIALTAALCVGATLLFSLGPALRAARADVVHDLKQGGDAGARARWNRLFTGRSLLVMGQLALSLALLFASGLFFRAALQAGNLDVGFEPAGHLVTELDYSLTQATPDRSLPRALDLLAQVTTGPGIRSASLATGAPFTNVNTARRLVPAGAPATPSADPDSPEAGFNGNFTAVSAGYFDSLGIRLLRGRDFTPEEARHRDAPGVVIVDERMARSLFPDRDALGQRVRYSSPPTDGSPAEMEIIGIVNSHRRDTLSADAPRRIFVPLVRGYSGRLFLHARLANASPAFEQAAIAPFRATLQRIDPSLPVLALEPFTDLMNKNFGLWIVRFAAALFGVFGGVALVLAVVGVYGVNAYAVASRTREIGVRMAIGARPGDVLRLILRQTLRQTLVAVGAGLALSLLAGQALAAMLYRVSPTDPLVLSLATLVLAGATLAACWLPARRATRVDPLVALRTE